MADVPLTSKANHWPHDWSHHDGICATCRRCGAQEVDGQGAPQHCSALMMAEIERLQLVIAGMIQGLKDADMEAKHCPEGQCRHVTRTEKQKAHGTPQEFRRAVINAVGDFLSHDEANQAIDRYEREWGAAP